MKQFLYDKLQHGVPKAGEKEFNKGVHLQGCQIPK